MQLLANKFSLEFVRKILVSIKTSNQIETIKIKPEIINWKVCEYFSDYTLIINLMKIRLAANVKAIILSENEILSIYFFVFVFYSCSSSK